MTFKNINGSKNNSVQTGQTATMESTTVIMEDSSAFMGGPTTTDKTKPKIKITKVRAR